MSEHNLDLVTWIEFAARTDGRGSLVAIEGSTTIPFDIKRVYYIFGTESTVSRGFHAHINLRQVAVCVAGSCRMLLDDGKQKTNVWLNTPDKGVIIDRLVWHEMHEFSSDCVLLVLASDHYDENDYLRKYEQFLEAKC